MNTNSRPQTTHLEKLTDQFGVWQFFENGQILKSEGYALDDSARALIVYLLYNKRDNANVCLSYLEKSLNDDLFTGFFNEHREPIIYGSSQDAHALAFWALAYAKTQKFEIDRVQSLLDNLNKTILYESTYIRAQSYTLIASSLLNDKEHAGSLANTIANQFNESFNWFEPLLTDDSRIFSSKVVCGSPRLGKDHRFLDRQPTDDLIELQRTLGVKMSES